MNSHENIKAHDPYVAAVDEIGDGWTFLITREAFFGAYRFEDYAQNLKISKARLAERLKHLVANGIMEKTLYQKSPQRWAYRLSKKGLGIYPIALAMINWARDWQDAQSEVNLIHASCGELLDVYPRCRACGEAIREHELEWPKILPLQQVILNNSSVRGWRKISNIQKLSDRIDPAIKILEVAGDRWSMLIVYGAIRTSFKFREAQRKLGIAHNILSDRLGKLIEFGVLEKQTDSRTAPYSLTDKGRALVPIILATRTWAQDHLNFSGMNWNAVTHKSCGHPLFCELACNHCNATVEPHEVSIETAG